MSKNYLIFVFLLVTLQAVSQHSIRGIITDAVTNQPISGVEVTLSNSRKGTISNSDGSFTIELVQFPTILNLNHLSYETSQFEILEKNVGSALSIGLIRKSFELEEINILSDVARERFNPISFNAISSDKIVTTLGDKPLPEVMNFLPSVYGVRSGGGSGDATLSIRGFQQENIAVLLNGVPINGAENGLVYWNNWMGLTEITSELQVQRGIGASKVALNSVGGTMNIITHFPKTEAGGTMSFQSTNYGNKKFTFSYNTGISDNGWALSFLGSRTEGEGYIDATYVDGWGYFMNLSKEISTKQRLVITLLGGPERHGQRNMMLTKNEMETYGYKYNKEWGSYNGQLNNASENFYHKPHLALTHYLMLNEKSLLATSVYVSPGWGGGKWNDSFNYGPTIFDFRNPSGQIDFESTYTYNFYNSDSYTLDNGQTVNGYSKAIQTNYLASHFWSGIHSSFETELNSSTKLITGLHYRFFTSRVKQEVANLLGGQYYIDDFGWSLAGVAGRNQIKMPGDVIKVDNGALLHQTSVFGQFEKRVRRINLFTALTLTDSRYQRQDQYNYPQDKWSEVVVKPGFDLKAGMNYNIDSYQNIFLNLAYFSKAPYYKFIFGNYTNTPVSSIQNEKVNTIETGYTIKNNENEISFSAYYTQWLDVSFLSDEYIQLENNEQTRAMISGLDAIHKGIEFEWLYKISTAVKLGGLASFGNWKWQNDVEARLINDDEVVVDTINVYAKGLYVGGQPQFQAGIMAQAKLFRSFDITLNLMYYDRHFAQFDPTGRQDERDRSQSYELPSYTMANIFMNYPIKIFNQETVIFMNVNNLLGKNYIIKGEDGASHDLDTFKGFWSFGRTFDFGIRISF